MLLFFKFSFDIQCKIIYKIYQRKLHLFLICKKNTISYYEKDFTFKDISDCEEAFVTGTFGGIVPVSTLEDKSLQSTNKESITNKIRTLYLQEIENYIKSQS